MKRSEHSIEKKSTEIKNNLNRSFSSFLSSALDAVRIGSRSRLPGRARTAVRIKLMGRIEMKVCSKSRNGDDRP